MYAACFLHQASASRFISFLWESSIVSLQDGCDYPLFTKQETGLRAAEDLAERGPAGIRTQVKLYAFCTVVSFSFC